MKITGVNESQSRERIKARMMRNAAESWGQPNTTIESFDPLVAMMIGACATELEKVSNELQSSQSRVLERLAQLLTPYVLKGPRAAHAIAHMQSIEPFSVLPRTAQFYVQKRLPALEGTSREEFAQVFFTPCCDVKLWDAKVRYLVSGNEVQQVSQVFEREKVVESNSGKKLHPEILYVGIAINSRIDSLEDMAFYFDWLNNADKHLFYRLLPFAKVYLDNELLKTDQGVTAREFDDSGLGTFKLEIDDDIAELSERQLLENYYGRYIRITEKQKFALKDSIRAYPSEFSDVFEQEDLRLLRDELLWLRIEFPPSMSQVATSDAICSLNCVPVMNRKLNEFSYRLQSGNNIIPLNSENNLYFSLKSVINLASESYLPAIGHEIHKESPGRYLLRQGGVQRFDTRTASELLKYLLDLLRDESAAFAIYGNDLLTNNLRELSQMMNTLSQKIERVENNEENITYLVIKPKSESENLFIEFWSTHGDFANGVRAGSKLTPYSSYDVRSETSFLLSTSFGGRDVLNNSETLQSFRRALLSRDRLVTPADIILLVKQELGNRQADVQIRHGDRMSADRKKGFYKVVEVVLKPLSDERTSPEQWDLMRSGLEAMINQKMNGYYPIHVIVNNKDN